MNDECSTSGPCNPASKRRLLLGKSGLSCYSVVSMIRSLMEKELYMYCSCYSRFQELNVKPYVNQY